MHFLSANLRELSNDDRVALSRLIVELLDRWRVEGDDQVAMLGLPADTAPRALRRYRENTPLPNSPEVNERIDHLLGIADALRTSNPCSATADVIWLHSVNRSHDSRRVGWIAGGPHPPRLRLRLAPQRFALLRHRLPGYVLPGNLLV
jgi:hypothetical protein